MKFKTIQLLKPKSALKNMTLGLILTTVVTVQAVTPLAQVPSIDLSKKIPGSTIQGVEDIENVEDLSLFFNDLLFSHKMNLPGWNEETENLPDQEEIYDAFAVRTTQDPTQILDGNSYFYAGKGVGRSGVWEKEKRGDSFARIHGRHLKGLTIKGYGGNAGKPNQPEGSLEVAEAYRDTVISKILMEKGADTYIGALTVVRPRASGGSTQANFIRLSRSSLRLNDIIDRKGEELRSTVDHLRLLVQEEFTDEMLEQSPLHAKYKIPTAEEFANWLVARSAQTLAHKEHARVTASNHNKDNFGIAELVDFGESKYDAFTFKIGYDVTGNGLANSFNGGLKTHIVAAANNIATEYGFQNDFSALFDDIYKQKSQLLIDQDNERILVDKASGRDLLALGLSFNTVKKILSLKKPFGILSTDELLKLNIPMKEKYILKNKTTTSFMKLEDGHIIPNAILPEVGGADGIRDILKFVLGDAAQPIESLSEFQLREKFTKAVIQKMTAMGTNKYKSSWGSFGPNIDINLGTLLTRKVLQDPQKWVHAFKTFPQEKSVQYNILSCQSLFLK